MARMKVKDMSRRQQRAVFANMTDDKYLRKLENAEDYRARMAYLKHKHDLAESTEDKLFDVWNNKKLTYRQKMSKVGEIKADAKKRLERYQKEEKATGVVSKIRKENVKRFEKEYGIGEVGNKKRVSLAELETGAKIEYKEHKELGMPAARKIAADHLKEDKNYYNKSKTPLTRHDELMKTTTQTEYRVHYQGSIQGHYVIAKNAKQAKDIVAEQKGYSNKGLLVAVPWKTWKGGKATRIKQKDTDKDGVPDHLDCEPKNPKKQGSGRLHNIGKYYVEGLTTKTLKRKSSRFFDTQKEAEIEAMRRQKNKTIVQADIFKVENAISDKVVSTLDTKQQLTSSQHEFKKAKRLENKRNTYTPNRQKFYKDAYSTREEADDIADYLQKDEHKKDVFVFKDKDGDWNIAYKE